jgi:putative tricarboxylic transport membrane protein
VASVVVLLAGSGTACSGGGATARATGADFFRGRTLTYIVATDPGGGYDTYGRLVAKYLTRHLGLQAAVVRNVPGGGHLRGAATIYNAPPDGLTIGTFNTGLLYTQLLRSEEMPGDLRAMSWIGKAGEEARVLTMSARSGFRTVADLRRAGRPLLLGSSGAGNQSHFDSLLLSRALGLPIKLVFGLASREAQLSMLRGEIDGEVGSFSTAQPFVRNGYGTLVLRVGSADGLDEAVPDARTLTATTEGRALVDVVASLTTLLRWTAGPPGIPADRLTALRQAYTAALADPALLEEARALEIPIASMDGATLAREIDRVLSLPDDTLTLVADVVDGAAAR